MTTAASIDRLLHHSIILGLRLVGEHGDTVSSPDDPASPQEEMASTPLVPPDGWMQRNPAAEMTSCVPPGVIILEKTQLNRRAAATGAEQRGRPWNRAVTDHVDPTRLNRVWKILDDFSQQATPRTQQVNQPPPTPYHPVHETSPRRLSSAHSRRGLTSPCPTCLLSSEQGSPSLSCS